MTRSRSPAVSNPSTPAQHAMKQTSKTSAESDGGTAPADSGGGTEAAHPARRAVRPGDAGVGQSSNQGSSPYQDRARPEEAERNDP